MKNTEYNRAKQLRTSKKYILEIAGSYVEGKCIDSKKQLFQYCCPFAERYGEVKFRIAYFMRGQIFNAA